ncbi:MAG: hypothetical protein HY781_05525 [Chloroflexi bacterium]|nr:hypothetical protein [Chloroflexota bacterium]
MKKLAFPLLILTFILLACNITPVPTTESPVTEPPVTEPPVTEPPVTEPPVTEPPVMTNLTCNELSLYLDPALASGYDCQVVPESPYEMEMYPEHTELSLQGYPLVDKFFEPHISIYSVSDYTILRPDFVPNRVAELQAILTSGSIPPYTSPFHSYLPFLPTFGAGEAFYAQAQVFPFMSGNGIRFLTEFAQYTVPVNNTDLFYTYQGLTSDGQYWVSVILPINHTMLPGSADPLPGGVSFEDFANNYDPYILDMVNQLNSQSPSSYTPTITALDALVSSITITP